MARERITLTIAEVASMLGISRGLVYELVEREELPGVRLGRRWVVPVRAFEQWLDEVTPAVHQGR